MPGGWNGYEYWMALTPYAFENDDLENPSILASHDNVTWRVPNGLKNPLNRIIGGSWNADTELVLLDGVMYCFWRYWDTTNGHLMARTSTDGVHWTPVLKYNTGAGHKWTSPGIHVLNGVWHAWGEQDSLGVGQPKRICHLTATDPKGPWSAAVSCTLNHFPAGRDPWHLDVTRARGYWWMVVSDGIIGTTGSDGRLVLGTSRDGETWNISEHVMRPLAGSWCDSIIYRPTILIEGSIARIWHGGVDATNHWRIGYTEIPTRRFPEPPPP